MFNREQMVAEIAKEVVSRLQAHMNGGTSQSVQSAPAPVPSGTDGVFETVDEAVKASAEAQKKVAGLSLEERGKIVTIIRDLCESRKQEFGKLELDETGLGRLDHKLQKLEIVKNVLGVEAMRSDARTDKYGMCLIERAPWGVIGMVLPATHPIPTMASNAINVIAAGNTAVFSPHPVGAKAACYALQVFNREIRKEVGIENALTTLREPSIRSAEEIFKHPDIALLCVTGGPAVVRAASKHGKRVIAAGPGNPPVVVDETADLDHAAECIIEGAAFDNNLLCIGEKEIFVVASVASAFIEAMRRAGAFELNAAQIEKLTQAAFTFEGGGKGCGRAHVKKEFVGKDASVLAAAAGVRVPQNTPLLFGETNEDHPFVVEEQMMPFIPVVRVKDVDAGIRASVKAEHGYRHTAIIHTQDVGNATRMARAVNTTLFVQNASSPASIGVGGPGYFSHSIATPTGEGVTTPLTFTRERQMVIGNGLRII